jgi:O-antigen ligase
MIPAMIAIVLCVVFLIPGSVERLTEGFSAETRDSNDNLEGIYESDENKPDLYTIMSGRNIAWQFVMPKIMASPFIGYGRQAMIRAGIARFLWQNFEEEFPHPHNAYLELLLDNGLAGFLIIIPFYWLILKYSLSLFRDLRSPVFIAVGGVSSALVLALLFASFGSQTFYPREGSVGMWCAIGLMLRVYVERANTLRVARNTPSGECEASDRNRTNSLFGPFTDNVQDAYSKRSDGRLRLQGRIE